MKKQENKNISKKIKKLQKGNGKVINISDIFTIEENFNINENLNKESINCFDNLDINEELSKKSYESMFSVISKNDNNSNNENEIKRNDSYDSQISTLSSKNQSISFWKALKLELSNLKHKIIFNHNIFTTTNNITNLSNKVTKDIQIFDEQFSDHDKLINRLKNIPWFSYRENFQQIKQNEIIYSSDSGWGCMLRSAQMIFAQGLYKLSSINNLNDFMNQYMSYFYDNKIPIKYLNKIENKHNRKESDNKINEEKYEEINNYNGFEIINKDNSCSTSNFIDLSCEIINGLENMCKRYKYKENITPPFSIRNFIKVENKINKEGKKVGSFFSNFESIRLITAINYNMVKNKDCDFKVFHFEDGTIYIEDIIKTCLEEDKDENIDDFEFLSSNDSINDDIKNSKYIFNNKQYIFKYKFIIFVNCRHGMYQLNEEIYNEIFKLFNIQTNIGFIGGKKRRAFYFIGKCGINLIFLDPHFVQSTIQMEQLGTDFSQNTYIPNDIFYMPINELSPAFTIGFAVKDMENFKMLMKKLTCSDYFFNQQIKQHKVRLFTVKNSL